MVTFPKKYLYLTVAAAILSFLFILGFFFLKQEKEFTGQERKWHMVSADHAWSFPRDHWARPEYRSEWWYFTGHLTSIENPRQRFGYQFTFFRWGAKNEIMGHAAITDLTSGRHVFSELAYATDSAFGGFGLYPDPLIAWSQAPPGGDGKWTLRWNGDGFDVSMRDDVQKIAYKLSIHPVKPLVFHGPNGFRKKSNHSSNASLYYSFTRLQTEGTLSLDGKSVEVRGESWMDREAFSTLYGENQIGWDWFSLQFDDGREIMVYQLRNKAGGIDFAFSTLVSPEGKARYLAPEEWTVRATSTWKSPTSGAEFPSRWTMELPGENLRLEIIPELADQENRSRTLGASYWEGAVSVRAPRGERLGRGYVELVGYKMKKRPTK